MKPVDTKKYLSISVKCVSIFDIKILSNESLSSMSYKHNNLMAIRENYWKDEHSHHVQTEKHFFCNVLEEHGIFHEATLEDAKYFFFALPSIIIVKGYALGFMHDQVKQMIFKYIAQNKTYLQQRSQLKIQYRMS